MSSRAPVVIGALFALVGLACDGGSALPPDLGCESSRECNEGLACSFNHCVVPDPNRLALHARIIPPPTSGLLEQQLPTLTLDDGPDRLVQLIEPKVIRGTVRPRADGGGGGNNPLVSNVEGDITVRSAGDIPGLDFVFSAHSLDGLDTDGFGYTLTLLPGRDYTGTFRPSDPALPRHVFSIKREDIKSDRFDISLPAFDTYLKVEGRVMKSDYTPITNARIIVLANREVAATAVSDAPRGRFEVLLPPGLTTFAITVESPADGPVFPEFTTEPMTWLAGSEVDLVVPELAPGTEPIEARLRIIERKSSVEGLAPALVPAVGRRVTIIGVLAGGTLKRSGTTDEQGEVVFHALPGAYECLIASPPQAAAATWHDFVNLASWQDPGAADVVEIELAPRAPFVGRITDAFGAPVEAGTITLERRRDAKAGDQLVIAPQPFEAKLGTDGVFMTAVDPGTYDVLIAPEPGTGAPHAFETDVVVGGEGLRFDLGLPPPGLLHLTVAGPDGAWIPGTQVELWIDDDLGEPRLLSIGSTGEQGFVDVLVPHVQR